MELGFSYFVTEVLLFYSDLPSLEIIFSVGMYNFSAPKFFKFQHFSLLNAKKPKEIIGGVFFESIGSRVWKYCKK